MSSSRYNLDFADRQIAHALWEALVGNDESGDAASARQRLMEAPSHIQQAITHEIASALRQGIEPHARENPFFASARAEFT